MATVDSFLAPPINIINNEVDLDAALESTTLCLVHFSRYRSATDARLSIVSPEPDKRISDEKGRSKQLNIENDILRCFSHEIDHMAFRRKKIRFARAEYNQLPRSQLPQPFTLSSSPNLQAPIFSPKAGSEGVSHPPSAARLSSNTDGTVHTMISTDNSRSTGNNPQSSPSTAFGYVGSSYASPSSAEAVPRVDTCDTGHNFVPRTPMVSLQHGPLASHQGPLILGPPNLPVVALFSKFFHPPNDHYSNFPCIIAFENGKEVKRFTPCSTRQMAIDYVNNRAAAAALQAIVDEQQEAARQKRAALKLQEEQLLRNSGNSTAGVSASGPDIRLDDDPADITANIGSPHPNMPDSIETTEGNPKLEIGLTQPSGEEINEANNIVQEKDAAVVTGVRFAGSFSATSPNNGPLGTDGRSVASSYQRGYGAPQLTLPPNPQQVALAGGSENNATFLILLEDYIRAYRLTSSKVAVDPENFFASNQELEAAAVEAAQNEKEEKESSSIQVETKLSEHSAHQQNPSTKYIESQPSQATHVKEEKVASSRMFCC